MKPKQLCYWSEVSSSPHKAVGSHILAGFIFTLSVLRRCSGGKRRNSEGTNLILSLSPTVLCGERNFPSGPLNASHLQTVVLQYLCKIRTASPAVSHPLSPACSLNTQHRSHLRLISRTLNHTQSSDPGLRTTSSSYIKATLSTVPMTWEALFSKRQIHFVSRVSRRQGQVSLFFPYLFFFCLGLRCS